MAEVVLLEVTQWNGRSILPVREEVESDENQVRFNVYGPGFELFAWRIDRPTVHALIDGYPAILQIEATDIDICVDFAEIYATYYF